MLETALRLKGQFSVPGFHFSVNTALVIIPGASGPGLVSGPGLPWPFRIPRARSCLAFSLLRVGTFLLSTPRAAAMTSRLEWWPQMPRAWWLDGAPLLGRSTPRQAWWWTSRLRLRVAVL